jgi:translation elongation factor EF-Ts
MDIQKISDEAFKENERCIKVCGKEIETSLKNLENKGFGFIELATFHILLAVELLAIPIRATLKGMPNLDKEKFIEKIIEGKVNKFYQEVCLLFQPFIKNDKITVEQHLKEASTKIANKITVKQFTRFGIGR